MTNTNNPVKVSEEDYMDACDNYMGWCTNCQEFSRESCEPDCENYDCPNCEEDSVFGAEQALIMGLFEIDEEEE